MARYALKALKLIKRMTQKRSRAIDILCEPTLYLDNLSGLKKLQRKLTASQRNMPYVCFFLTFLKHLLNVKYFFFKNQHILHLFHVC